MDGDWQAGLQIDVVAGKLGGVVNKDLGAKLPGAVTAGHTRR